MLRHCCNDYVNSTFNVHLNPAWNVSFVLFLAISIGCKERKYSPSSMLTSQATTKTIFLLPFFWCSFSRYHSQWVSPATFAHIDYCSGLSPSLLLPCSCPAPSLLRACSLPVSNLLLTCFRCVPTLPAPCYHLSLDLFLPCTHRAPSSLSSGLRSIPA